MSMMVSFVLSFFPRNVLDEILNLIESVSEDFPSYSNSSKSSGIQNLFLKAPAIAWSSASVEAFPAPTLCFSTFALPMPW